VRSWLWKTVRTEAGRSGCGRNRLSLGPDLHSWRSKRADRRAHLSGHLRQRDDGLLRGVRMPAPKDPEFRPRAVEPARLREKPIAQIAKTWGLLSLGCAVAGAGRP
jgi:hypothetical protein